MLLQTNAFSEIISSSLSSSSLNHCGLYGKKHGENKFFCSGTLIKSTNQELKFLTVQHCLDHHLKGKKDIYFYCSNGVKKVEGKLDLDTFLKNGEMPLEYTSDGVRELNVSIDHKKSSDDLDRAQGTLPPGGRFTRHPFPWEYIGSKESCPNRTDS